MAFKIIYVRLPYLCGRVLIFFLYLLCIFIMLIIGMRCLMLTEQCLRAEGKALFGSLATRQADCISALVRLAAVCSHINTPTTVKEHCVTLLSGKQQFSCFFYGLRFHCLFSSCQHLPAFKLSVNVFHCFKNDFDDIWLNRLQSEVIYQKWRWWMIFSMRMYKVVKLFMKMSALSIQLTIIISSKDLRY